MPKNTFSNLVTAVLHKGQAEIWVAQFSHVHIWLHGLIQIDISRSWHMIHRLVLLRILSIFYYFKDWIYDSVDIRVCSQDRISDISTESSNFPSKNFIWSFNFQTSFECYSRSVLSYSSKCYLEISASYHSIYKFSSGFYRDKSRFKTYIFSIVWFNSNWSSKRSFLSIISLVSRELIRVSRSSSESSYIS